MKSSHAHHLSALLAGVLFGVGLLVSGMTQPNKVLGFLDPFGHFDASLIFVMLGAIGVHLLAYRYRRARNAPFFGAVFVVPSRRDVDAKLLFGSLLFGMGWGLGGYCPGPALVSLPGGKLGTLVFAAAMIAGMFATAKLESVLTRKKAGTMPAANQSVAASAAPVARS